MPISCKLLSILIMVFLSGCISNRPDNFEALKSEINNNTQNGMPINQALAEFNRLDFVCHEGTSIDPNTKSLMECHRDKQGIFYTCIHRVWLDNATPNGSVSNLKVLTPLCASL